MKECDDCISVSLLRYPKYNKTKHSRAGAVLSSPKWYVYVIYTHSLKNHNNENTIDINEDNEDQGNENVPSADDFRELSRETPEASSSNNIGSLVQCIEGIPENDDEPTINPSTSKRKFRFARSAHIYKKRRN